MSNFSELVEWVNEDASGNSVTAHAYLDPEKRTVEVDIVYLDELFRKYGYERRSASE